MNQRHKNFPLHTPDLTYCLFDLGVTTLVAFFFNAFIYPLGDVTLLLWKALVGVNDLSDAFKRLVVRVSYYHVFCVRMDASANIPQRFQVFLPYIFVYV